jgi:tryptophanyl-tRNA synthetase
MFKNNTLKLNFCLRKSRRSFTTESTVQTVSITDPNFKLPNNSTILSGIQPTGTFHLGNYFGAIKSWHDLNSLVKRGGPDSNSSLYFFVADLHSLTVPQDYQVLKQQRLEAFASIIACGIDPNLSTIYYQSCIPEITSIQWVFSCFTSMGYLNRMTQWKSKANLKDSANVSDNNALGKVKLGLFGYPVLMASDVLTFRATHVPVGQDQSQHLELTREIAESFNKTVNSQYFKIPNTMLTPTKKILSLKNPTKKMSKSDKEPLSKIFITDPSEEIIEKFNKATTDSIDGKLTFDLQERPGVSNLIGILAAATNKSIEHVAEEVADFSKRELKQFVAESVIKELEEPSRKYKELINNPEYLEKLSRQGTEKARTVANQTLKEVMKLTGMGHY